MQKMESVSYISCWWKKCKLQAWTMMDVRMLFQLKPQFKFGDCPLQSSTAVSHLFCTRQFGPLGLTLFFMSSSTSNPCLHETASSGVGQILWEALTKNVWWLYRGYTSDKCISCRPQTTGELSLRSTPIHAFNEINVLMVGGAGKHVWKYTSPQMIRYPNVCRIC